MAIRRAFPGLEVVATGPTHSAPGKPNGGVFTATLYPGPRGNFVFNAATCWWADGLSAPPGYMRPKVYTEPLEAGPAGTADYAEYFGPDEGVNR